VRWIVWAALAASVLIYFGVALSGLFGSGPPAGASWLPTLFGAAGVTAAIAAHLLWRRATGAGLPAHRQGAGAPGLVSALGAGLLAAWALDEAIAVLGLALALLGYLREDWFLFFVVSLALLLAHRPVSRRA
jgi:hypothetical protein